jgi:hypothetical protein
MGKQKNRLRCSACSKLYNDCILLYFIKEMPLIREMPLINEIPLAEASDAKADADREMIAATKKTETLFRTIFPLL